MNPDGVWYQLLPASVFVTTNIDGAGPQVYRWQQPDILLESSNGMLWFRSANGMANLDPQKGEWCWFTTYQSNIVEDSAHNLWMIADGKLYKHPLKTNP